ncbi:MAG: glycosyltransferase family 39 protein [Clostridia bacterium]
MNESFIKPIRLKICDFCGTFSIVLTCLAFAAVTMVSFFVTCTVDVAFSADNNEHVLFTRDSFFLNVLILIACVGLLLLLLRCRVTHRSNHVLTLTMLAVITALGIWWVQASNPVPYADSQLIIAQAQLLAVNDYASLAHSTYFRLYPFQTGFLLFAEGFARIFGTVQLVQLFPYFNILCVDAAYLVLVLMTHSLFDDVRVTFLSILFLGLCLQPVFLCTFIYGVLPGFALALWGTYCVIRYLKGGRWTWLIGAALLLPLALLLKKNYTILLLANAIVLLLHALRKHTWKPVIMVVVLAVLAIVSPVLAQRSYEIRADTTLGKGMPQSAWLLMGLSESSMCSGWYNAQMSDIFAENDFDAEAMSSQYTDEIAGRIRYFSSRPRYLAAFTYYKIASQWNTPSFQSVWSSAAGDHSGELSPFVFSLCYGNASKHLETYFNFYIQLVYACFTVALLLLCRHRNRTDGMLIFPLAILGAFLYHALFEAKAQYALIYIPMMLPLSAYALVRLKDTVDKQLNQRHRSELL